MSIVDSSIVVKVDNVANDLTADVLTKRNGELLCDESVSLKLILLIARHRRGRS